MNDSFQCTQYVQILPEYFPDAILIAVHQLIITDSNAEAKNFFCATENELNSKLLQECNSTVSNNFIKNQFANDGTTFKIIFNHKP